MKRAGWWIVANAVAWAVGMAFIFAAMGNIPVGTLTPRAVLLLFTMLAGAGATVGAIHGVVLGWLLHSGEELANPR